jgi:hypothetical protein
VITVLSGGESPALPDANDVSLGNVMLVVVAVVMAIAVGSFLVTIVIRTLRKDRQDPK